MRRGEVWLVAFDPVRGSELKKTRPAIIVSSDDLIGLPIKIVVPLTGWKPHHDRWPWIVRIDPTPQNGLDKPSSADAYQVCRVAHERLIQKRGVVTAEELEAVVMAVAMVIGAV